MSKGVTQDTTTGNHSGANPTFLRFSGDNGLLGKHPILRGRDGTEQVSTVVTFSGQSLTPPPGAAPLLVLSPLALNRAPPTRAQNAARAERMARLRDSILAARAASGGAGDSVVVIRQQPGTAGRVAPTFT